MLNRSARNLDVEISWKKPEFGNCNLYLNLHRLKIVLSIHQFELLINLYYIRIEKFRTEKFRKNNFGQKTFGRFFGNFGSKNFRTTTFFMILYPDEDLYYQYYRQKYWLFILNIFKDMFSLLFVVWRCFFIALLLYTSTLVSRFRFVDLDPAAVFVTVAKGCSFFRKRKDTISAYKSGLNQV